jgi:hypothetical protein
MFRMMYNTRIEFRDQFSKQQNFFIGKKAKLIPLSFRVVTAFAS